VEEEEEEERAVCARGDNGPWAHLSGSRSANFLRDNRYSPLSSLTAGRLRISASPEGPTEDRVESEHGVREGPRRRRCARSREGAAKPRAAAS
jgi:hypothetical protein